MMILASRTTPAHPLSRYPIPISRRPSLRRSKRFCGRQGCRADPWRRRLKQRLRPISGANTRLRSQAARSGCCWRLASYGIGPEHEVIASPYSFRETAHAISLAGARPVFADIDYWAGTLVADKVEACITEKTRAIVACNNNGHPAPWPALRAVAKTARPRAYRGFDRSDRLAISGGAGRDVRRCRGVRFFATLAIDLRRRRHGGDRRC